MVWGQGLRLRPSKKTPGCPCVEPALRHHTRELRGLRLPMPPHAPNMSLIHSHRRQRPESGQEISHRSDSETGLSGANRSRTSRSSAYGFGPIVAFSLEAGGCAVNNQAVSRPRDYVEASSGSGPRQSSQPSPAVIQSGFNQGPGRQRTRPTSWGAEPRVRVLHPPNAIACAECGEQGSVGQQDGRGALDVALAGPLRQDVAV